MRTIGLTQQKIDLNDLLKLASRGSLLILSNGGHQHVLEETDEPEKEVAMLGKSNKSMKFLEKRSKEEATISIDELEKISFRPRRRALVNV